MDTLKRLLDRLRGQAVTLWQRLSADIFAVTGLKIVFLYMMMGAATAAIGTYFLYGHVIRIIGSSIVAIEAQIGAGTPMSEITAQKIVMNVTLAEIGRMHVGDVIMVLVLMIFAAYLLAGIMLAPIRRAAERQKQLIANVAHELRTPLSVMKTNTEVIFAGDAKPTREELMAGLTSSLEEVDRMTNIVKFFLNFWLGKDWEKKIKLSDVNLTAVARATVKFMDVIAKEKGVALAFHDDAGSAFISGDVLTLEEMLVNLLKNSIAYTPAGGRIDVRVSHVKAIVLKEITLSVEDTGIGIPPQDLPNIFEPFYRGDNAYSQRTRRRGTGIGLTIVKEIANLHDAKISIDSELGKGTRISIAFPAASSSH